MPATDRQPNRLVHETSPYLLQHAYNPVDWYPWGEEALQAAREQDKPIFLSIGYSACHWCHVMEHESFENDEIAGLMNQWFVNIKVDREERPDLDQIYMQAVIAQTGQGGWPMSVFLDHDLRCFYGGTYWPPEQRFGRPGFRDVLAALHEAWSNQRDGLIDRGNRVTEAVREMSLPRGETSELNADLLEKAARTLLRAADRTHGGFGGAPKFPHPMDIRLLLRAWKRFGMEDALHVARFTLDKMAAGGIYDHLGGGFHRYATDARWLVPHFEKMLYDNALLVPAYLEAYQAAGDADDVRVVRETLDYILREMTQPEGGFYSTQDADSEGVEGKFFVWTEDEIIRLLGHDDARVFNACYDVTPQGNWDDPHGHAPPGPNNILNRPKPLDQMAKDLGLDEQEMTAILDRGRKTLLAAREQRVAPGRDEKVLASWNGLMIAAMAQAAQVLDEPRYAEAARAAAAFILEQMREPDGRLLHSYKDGRARFNGHLDDYAGLIDGLVELYQATFEPRWLEAAAELADRMIAQFGDAEAGGFFYTSVDHEELLVRQKDSQDGATPAGNSLTATALLKLARLSGRTDFEEQAVGTLRMLSGQMASIAAASGQAMLALDFLLGPTYEVAVAAGESPEETQQVLRTLHARFMPNKVVAVHQADAENAGIVEPLFEGRPPEAGRATVYLCRQGTCGLPIVGNETLQQEWEGITAQSASP